MNQRLKEMDVNFIEASEEGDKASQLLGAACCRVAVAGWLVFGVCCCWARVALPSRAADLGLPGSQPAPPACCLLLARLHAVACQLGNTGHSRPQLAVC